MLCDPWVESLLKHKLVKCEHSRTKQRFFVRLFMDKYFTGHFVLNPITEFVGYSSIKANWKMKNLEE